MTDTTTTPPVQAPADAKPIWASRTVIAVGVSVCASVAQHYGHAIAAEDQAALIDDITQLLQYGGMAAAVVFRVLASKPLK